MARQRFIGACNRIETEDILWRNRADFTDRSLTSPQEQIACDSSS
jgi:hypothetical protein